MRCASRTSSWPFMSSEPTLSRPTVGLGHAVDGAVEGLAHDGELDQLLGVAVDVGADVQHGGDALQASASWPRGRAGPGRRSCAGSAWRSPSGRRCCRPRRRRRPRPSSPPRRRSTWLEPLPRRRAWAGFSSMAMTLSVWRTSRRRRPARQPGQLGADRRLVAVQQEAHALAAVAPAQRDAGDDDGRPVVAAHGVDGNHAGIGQGVAYAPVQRRRAALQSRGTIQPAPRRCKRARRLRQPSPVAFGLQPLQHREGRDFGRLRRAVVELGARLARERIELQRQMLDRHSPPGRSRRPPARPADRRVRIELDLAAVRLAGRSGCPAARRARRSRPRSSLEGLQGDAADLRRRRARTGRRISPPSSQGATVSSAVEGRPAPPDPAPWRSARASRRRAPASRVTARGRPRASRTASLPAAGRSAHAATSGQRAPSARLQRLAPPGAARCGQHIGRQRRRRGRRPRSA